MNGIASRFVRFCVALLGLVTLGWVLTGHAAKPAHQRVPLVTDWSHRHLIFSQAASPQRARLVANGPRYWQQLERFRQRVLVQPELSKASAPDLFRIARGTRRFPKMHRDWAEDLGATAGPPVAGNYPAKFSFDSTTASCTNDYVVFSTDLQGSLTQAAIVAFNNLYLGCGGAVPSVLWAYNTSPITPARILTSPALSLDGSQLAFVQTAGPDAQLVLLKWVANSLESVTLPGIPTTVPLAAYRLCVAPCMTTINLTDLSNAHTDDRTSSVFIDYKNDVAWVGDSGGSLHQFTGVFKGTPAEVRDATWPVLVSTTAALTSPVFDHVTGNVIAGAADGFLYRVDSTTGAVTASGRLDFGTGIGIVAGPVVDSGAGTVYVSASSDGTTNCTGSTPCAALYRLSTSFAASTTGSEVVVGTSSATPKPMYNGFFDSAYLNSLDGTGNYYVCGNTGAQPTVYQVPVSPGGFGTPVTVSVLTRTQNQPCSPVTDIANPNTTGGASERVFVSAQADGWPTNCVSAAPGGCIMNFVVTQWHPLTIYSVGQEVLVRSADNPNVLFIQVVQHAGTSGPTTPAWGAAPDIITGDPDLSPTSVGWLNQGRIDATPILPWSAGLTAPFVGDRILDSNGNVELVDVAGTTGGTQPVWPTAVGALTVDGSMTWREAGPVATLALPASGGTSGIIVDNVVGSGTLLGASQIYFSTLSDQDCPDAGHHGGCAVQASQPALQ